MKEGLKRRGERGKKEKGGYTVGKDKKGEERETRGWVEKERGGGNEERRE